MLHKLNIEKYENNIESLLNKVCSIEAAQYNKENNFNVVFDFKKLPAPLYAFLRDCVDMNLDLFNSSFELASAAPEKQIRLITGTSDWEFTNKFTNIYLTFYNKLLNKMKEDFFVFTPEGFITNGSLIQGSKKLMCSVGINTQLKPEFVKYREKSNFIKPYEKLFLDFLQDIKKISFKPIVSNELLLQNKVTEDSLFKLLIDCLNDRVYLTVRVDKDCFEEDRLNSFKENIEVIQQTVNSLYSIENTNFDTINKTRFEIMLDKNRNNKRELTSIYGFMNALQNAIYDLFKGQHSYLEIKDSNESIYISNNRKNELQRDYLDRKNIFVGYGNISLKNFSHIAKQINEINQNNSNSFLTNLLMGESS